MEFLKADSTGTTSGKYFVLYSSKKIKIIKFNYYARGKFKKSWFKIIAKLIFKFVSKLFLL